MTQEDKSLLLKDLCGRLPYGVKGKSVIINPDTNERRLYGIDVFESISVIMIEGGEEEFTPYLFPLSSMTEEQKKEISKRYKLHTYYGLYIEITNHSEGYWDDDNSCNLQDYLWLVDWFNKNHFDYRGLIEKGLAIDATGLNIY